MLSTIGSTFCGAASLLTVTAAASSSSPATSFRLQLEPALQFRKNGPDIGHMRLDPGLDIASGIAANDHSANFASSAKFFLAEMLTRIGPSRFSKTSK